MRLTAIRLSGFKSFVDPVIIPLAEQLTVVVGPNGCGKSNIIDAVRWVLGESSARTLRAQTQSDVIFAGSASRKRVGTASVELRFANETRRGPAEYAKFEEISVRRQLDSDGRSAFFINDVRCRRRDIVALFLGTGLGPDSYAIIGQGTISELVEAKPDELRSLLEEAAGVSLYRERRRETERRIASTRDNLARLTDIEDELDKQLRRLSRQAKAAERYRGLQQRASELQRTLAQQELLALEARQRELSARQTEKKQQEDELRTRATAATEQRDGLRQRVDACQAASDEQQTALYEQESLLAAKRESARERERERERTTARLEELALAAQELRAELDRERQLLKAGKRDLEELAKRMSAHREDEQKCQNAQRAAQDHVERLRTELRGFEEKLAEAQSARQLLQAELRYATSRSEEITERRNRLARLMTRLEDELEELPDGKLDTSLRRAEEQASRELEQTTAGYQKLLDRRRSTTATLRDIENDVMQSEAMRRSLETLLSATSENVVEGPSVLSELEVDEGYEKAVETVLGNLLDARIIRSFAQIEGLDGALHALRSSATSRGERGLATHVTGPEPLLVRLAFVELRETAAEAQAAAQQASDRSFVSRDGWWFGSDFVLRDADADKDSRLERQRELRSLDKKLVAMRERADELGEQLRQNEIELETQQERAQEYQEKLRACRERSTAERARAEASRERREALQRALAERQSESAELDATSGSLVGSMEETRARLQQIVLEMEQLQPQTERLRGDLGRTLAQEEKSRDVLRETQQARHSLELEQRSLETEIASRKTYIEGLEERLARTRREDAEQRDRAQKLTVTSHPGEDLEDLEKACRVLRDKLDQSRSELTKLRNAVREAEADELTARQQLDTAREQTQALVAQQAELRGLQHAAEQKLAEAGGPVGEPAKEKSASELRDELEQTRQTMQRLEPVNLAAIEEKAEVEERAGYLNQQREDLESSLAQLETAMQKMDRESRQLLQETFHGINRELKQLYPRLVGEGQAYLEMDGEDWLSAGIRLMVRPPGKRVSSIHLLSGGEKALAGIALVFAMFELNPAPICLLDEVDAPLDDANVERFAALVKNMSAQVQILCVTHNKLTMEIADRLLGVTMREAGVSRIVGVELSEARSLADA